MKKIELPKEFLELLHPGWIHVLTYNNDEFKLPGGYENITEELSKLKKELIDCYKDESKTEKEFSFTIGNHLNFHDCINHLSFSKTDLFKEFEVILFCYNEQVIGIAPVCNTKNELNGFLNTINYYCNDSDIAPFFDNKEKELCERIATFFYKNNPKKTD